MDGRGWPGMVRNGREWLEMAVNGRGILEITGDDCVWMNGMDGELTDFKREI